ncbi:hypothetical protein EV356DRAFT_104294 [Viridothelium virens]|uniref:Uncharacterized protein n=1 Tax=Viridothelium virens TaxID=1048519 RepID=A0A6A6HNZ9_VIRVR|nr:hypothetical protein EV356DRAFT_104294 [Viridothelium virens]
MDACITCVTCSGCVGSMDCQVGGSTKYGVLCANRCHRCGLRRASVRGETKVSDGRSWSFCRAGAMIGVAHVCGRAVEHEPCLRMTGSNHHLPQTQESWDAVSWVEVHSLPSSRPQRRSPSSSSFIHSDANSLRVAAALFTARLAARCDHSLLGKSSAATAIKTLDTPQFFLKGTQVLADAIDFIVRSPGFDISMIFPGLVF